MKKFTFLFFCSVMLILLGFFGSCVLKIESELIVRNAKVFLFWTHLLSFSFGFLAGITQKEKGGYEK